MRTLVSYSETIGSKAWNYRFHRMKQLSYK